MLFEISRILIPNAKPPIRVESFPRDGTTSDVLMNLDPPIVILRTSAIEKKIAN